MPPPSKLSQLPKDLLEELDARLRATGFGELVQHAEWLKSLGHDIGKSALGEYSLKHRDGIKARFALGELDTATAVEVRLRCLEAASRAAAGTGEQVIALAERMLIWVLSR